MKITLNKSELLTLLSTHFNTSISEIIINDERIDIVGNVLSAIRREFGTSGVNDIISTKKINFIKFLRGIVPGLGLGQSKWISENWDQWFDFVERNNRYPVMTGDNYNGFSLA